jgi:steroid delta-isomerase-like uncharacterized protein
MSEQNKATVRRYFEEIVGHGNLEAVEELFAANYREYDPGSEEDIQGPDDVSRDVSAYRSAFPDLQVTVEGQVADGDQVASRVTVRGTHRGELLGLPPSGREITVTGLVIHRFAGGKLQEGWWNWDRLGLLRQIGAVQAGS